MKSTPRSIMLIRIIGVLSFVVPLVGLLGGCRRPYPSPHLVAIQPNETAFVIPLFGDAKKQDKFQSVEFLQSAKIGTKMYEIPQVWIQTGRHDFIGQWQDGEAVIKVDRSPVTVEFAVEDKEKPKKDADAIWVESSDSVGFSMGWSVTGLVNEDDAALFLYRYSGKTLKEVLSTEVRARIQSDTAQIAAKYPLDTLRTKKQEIQDFVANDCQQFFKSRGISITTIGQFGGMTDENKDIQEAIDKTFINQQAKVNSASALLAQKDVNAKNISAAEAEAEAIRQKARGDADAEKIRGEGKAAALEAVNKVAQSAANNPLLYQIKALEVQSELVQKWNGAYPTYYISGPGAAPSLLLNIPTAATVINKTN